MTDKLKNLFIANLIIFGLGSTAANAETHLLSKHPTQSTIHNKSDQNFDNEYIKFIEDFSKIIGKKIEKFNPNLDKKDIFEISKYLLNFDDIKTINLNETSGLKGIIKLDGIPIGYIFSKDNKYNIENSQRGSIKAFYKLLNDREIKYHDIESGLLKIKEINPHFISRTETILEKFKNLIKQTLDENVQNLTKKTREEIFNNIYNEYIKQILTTASTSKNVSEKSSLNKILGEETEKDIKYKIESLINLAINNEWQQHL